MRRGSLALVLRLARHRPRRVAGSARRAIMSCFRLPSQRTNSTALLATIICRLCRFASRSITGPLTTTTAWCSCRRRWSGCGRRRTAARRSRLFAEDRAAAALPQLAAGSAEQLSWRAWCFPSRRAAVLGGSGPGRRNDGHQSVRLLPGAVRRDISRSPTRRGWRSELRSVPRSRARRARSWRRISTRSIARSRRDDRFSGRPEPAAAAARSAT